MTDLTAGQRAVRDILLDCARRGMEPPFLASAINAKGGFVVVRYRIDRDDIQTETLATHRHDVKEFAYPLNVLVVDAQGDGRLYRLEVDKPPLDLTLIKGGKG
jgi:hypothetical protein